MSAPSASPAASTPMYPGRTPSSIAESYYWPYAVPCNSAAAALLPVAMNVVDNPGSTPAATLAPNFVFQSAASDGTVRQCMTETLGAGSVLDSTCSGAASIVACSQKSGVCADALTRGLLSALGPLLSGGNDSVFQYPY